MQEQSLYNFQDELDEELNINFKKIVLAVISRIKIIVITFLLVLIFFISLTYILPKKYKVEADLYINKSNNSNIADINPYVIEELGAGASLLSGLGSSLSNEMELVQSPLVIDKVILDNNIRYQKLFDIIPTVKTGEYMSAEKFVKKLSFENKKGTTVMSISFKSKNKILAYNVVRSVIDNYIELHKQINNEKSKSDIAILEKEYNKAKSELSNKMASINGMPAAAMSGSGNLTAMSAFSGSARKALSNIQGQYVAGEKSRLETQETAQKVAGLSSKLQWAKLVEEMSDSSKVIVIKEPRILKDYEQVSPKLFTQIILGIVFGVIFAFILLIFKEITDKKLTYSMLGNDIIYNPDKELNNFKSILISNNDKKIGFVLFEDISPELQKQIKSLNNAQIIKADISEEFKSQLDKTDKVILFEKIGKTESDLYKIIKNIISSQNKEILTEVLL